MYRRQLVKGEAPRRIPFLSPPISFTTKLGGSDTLRAAGPLGSKGLEMYTVHVLGIDGAWREYHVFASRAAAERSVIGIEAEGLRAKIYRTAVRPMKRNADVQGDHHRLWEGCLTTP
jgi:hypothetical protein